MFHCVQETSPNVMLH